jgi:diaminohydroxyphosphoribosylaminopyrimidine deaminase / 5-amino-6-(5-phosphoribosylamino)uracil reductase
VYELSSSGEGVQALLHRAVLGRPLSVLKYAMTLDGKIATHTGHSAWVSNASSRARVFEMRGRSDCVIVGGNTVRRDNPRLTTRRDSGHQPARIVMSRSLDLPEVLPPLPVRASHFEAHQSAICWLSSQ